MHRSTRVAFLWLSAAACCLGLGTSARATNLLDDFRDALRFDPSYATATADVDAQRLQARVARTAFYPEARLSLSQLDTDTASRTTLAITQPLLSWDRWLALKEANPREAAAAARLDQNQAELAQRVFRSVSTLADARERLRLNRNTVEALQVQEAGARRAFQLGQGTVTDLRDTEVRLAQARSQTFVLQSALEAAQRQYAAIVGRPPAAHHFQLRSAPAAPVLPPLTTFADRARSLNPAVRSAEVSVELAELSAKRAKAQFLPTLAAVAQRSEAGNNRTSSSAIALRMEVPVTAGQIFRQDAVALELRKAQDSARDVKQRIGLEVERLHDQVTAAAAELQVRREAMRAAALSVEANEQSFKGGARSKIDVLNALQAQFQAEAEFQAAQLRLGDALLNLYLLSASDIGEALALVQAALFQAVTPSGGRVQ